VSKCKLTEFLVKASNNHSHYIHIIISKPAVGKLWPAGRDRRTYTAVRDNSVPVFGVGQNWAIFLPRFSDQTRRHQSEKRRAKNSTNMPVSFQTFRDNDTKPRRNTNSIKLDSVTVAAKW